MSTTTLNSRRPPSSSAPATAKPSMAELAKVGTCSGEMMRSRGGAPERLEQRDLFVGQRTDRGQHGVEGFVDGDHGCLPGGFISVYAS